MLMMIMMSNSVVSKEVSRVVASGTIKKLSMIISGPIFAEADYFFKSGAENKNEFNLDRFTTLRKREKICFGSERQTHLLRH